MLLSVCIIVRDGAAFILRTINSVKNISDEIVVVDTGSDDNTKAIARQAGARVISYQWQHDFSQVRNYALKQARGQWVLFLDADEELSRDYKQLRPILVGRDCKGYYLPVIEMSSIHEMKMPRLLPRIFRRTGEPVFEGRIDQNLKPSTVASPSGAGFKVLQIPILHQNKYQIKTDLKPDDIYKFKSEELKKEIELYQKGRYKLVLNELELKFEDTEDIDKKYLYLSNMIFLVLKLNNPGKAKKLIQQGKKQFPARPEFDFWQGYLDYRMRRYQPGLKNLLRVIKNDSEIVDFKQGIYMLMGKIHKKIGNYKKAVSYFKKSDSGSRPGKISLNNMVEIFVEQGLTVDEILAELPERKGEICLLLLQVFYDKKEYDRGLKLIEIIKNDYGDSDQLLFWQGRCLLHLDQPKRAGKELKKISPGFTKFNEILDLLWLINLGGKGLKTKSNLNQIKLLGDKLSWKIISLFNKIRKGCREIVLDFRNLNFKYKFYSKCFYYLELLLEFAGDSYIEIMINIIESLQIKSVNSDLGNLFFKYQQWDKAENYLELSLENGINLNDLVRLADTYYRGSKYNQAANLYRKVLKFDKYSFHAYNRLALIKLIEVRGIKNYNDTDLEARKKEALEYLKEGLKKFPGVKIWIEVIKRLKDEHGIN